MKTLSTPFDGNILPTQHRIALVNILLLLLLPLLAHLGHLFYLSSTMEVNLPLEGSLAVVVYVVVSLGVYRWWCHSLRKENFRLRVERITESAARRGVTLTYSARTRPITALWLMALAGVLVSCYPIVFGGKSFVSPDTVSELLYNHAPTVPNSTRTTHPEIHGSDTGATMWQHMPFSIIEHRAIFQDHELPVWNRYDAGGLTLIGQGLSMLGDPLNWFVVLTGGSAWAWDVKFLIARLLFAAGIGLCVRAATGRLGAALVMTFSVCFLGFFIYRFDHPAYFSLCYAPWILLAWLLLVRERSENSRGGARYSWRWAALLLAACWMEYNSGTVKEALLLLLCLNATGLLILALDRRNTWRWKKDRLLQAVWMGVCFVLLSAPLWRTFAQALAHSWTAYEQPRAWQLQPGLLIGLFDDIFYRQFNAYEFLLDPSVNFVVLLGIAFALASYRTLVCRDRVFLALSLGALFPLAMVFGVVPPKWICAVPLLSSITHIDNTFSCGLLVLLPVLAGYGLERCRERLDAADFGWNYAAATVVILLPVAGFFGLVQAGQRSDFSPLAAVGQELEVSAFCRGYAAVLLAGCLVIPLLLRWWQLAGGAAAWGVIPALTVCLGALVWRGGLHESRVVGWGPYVMHPGERLDTRVHSPAVDRLLAATRQEPAVCMGFDLNLMGGFIATYGLESANCADGLQNAFYRELQDRSPALRQQLLFSVNQAAAASPLRRLYDLFNVRYYGGSNVPGTAAPPEVRGLRSLGRYDLDLYESPTAWPRAFFTDSILPCRKVTDVYAALGTEGERPFAAVSPVDIGARPDAEALASMLRQRGTDAGRVVVPATGYRFTSRTTSFHLRTPGPGVAILIEGYQTPYNAQVYLDGEAISHFRANWAFTGIRVPVAGEHEVRVVYGPRDLPALLAISALGSVLLAGTAWRVRWHNQIGRRSAGGDALAPVPEVTSPQARADAECTAVVLSD